MEPKDIMMWIIEWGLPIMVGWMGLISVIAMVVVTVLIVRLAWRDMTKKYW